MNVCLLTCSHNVRGSRCRRSPLELFRPLHWQRSQRGHLNLLIMRSTFLPTQKNFFDQSSAFFLKKRPWAAAASKHAHFGATFLSRVTETRLYIASPFPLVRIAPLTHPFSFHIPLDHTVIFACRVQVHSLSVFDHPWTPNENPPTVGLTRPKGEMHGPFRVTGARKNQRAIFPIVPPMRVTRPTRMPKAPLSVCVIYRWGVVRGIGLFCLTCDVCLSPLADSYEFKKGLAGIIAIIDYPNVSMAGYRNDVEILKDLLQNMGFDLAFEEINLTEAALVDFVRQFSRRPDLDQYDGMALFFLAMGENNKIYTVDNRPIRFERLKSFFSPDHCPQLVGRPKVFCVQSSSFGKGKADAAFDPFFQMKDSKAPVEEDEDFLFMTSIAPVKVMYDGSVFIRGLVGALADPNVRRRDHLADLNMDIRKSITKLLVTGPPEGTEGLVPFPPDEQRLVNDSVFGFWNNLTKHLFLPCEIIGVLVRQYGSTGDDEESFDQPTGTRPSLLSFTELFFCSFFSFRSPPPPPPNFFFIFWSPLSLPTFLFSSFFFISLYFCYFVLSLSKIQFDPDLSNVSHFPPQFLSSIISMISHLSAFLQCNPAPHHSLFLQSL
jgi:hypothetical protein